MAQPQKKHGIAGIGAGTSTQEAAASLIPWYWAWIALAIIVLLVVWVRVSLRDFPFERDEGEYAYMGQLMLRGIPPYESAYNMKFPGTYAAYALIMALFGQSVAAVHIGVLLVNVGAIVLVFLIARRLWDPLAGVMAAASYALLSMSQESLGMAGHATHFVVLPMLGAVLLMLGSGPARNWRYFAIGGLMGLAVLMKQPAAFFAIMAGGYILWTSIREPHRQWHKVCLSLGAFAGGVAVPLAVTGILLWHANVFEKFWFWTIVYARDYASQIPLVYAPRSLAFAFIKLAPKTWPLWSLAGAGLILLALSRQGRRVLPFIIFFTVASFLAICPGFYFRNHYFIMLMPAAALLIAGGLWSSRFMMRLERPLLAAILSLAVFMAIWVEVLAQESRFLLRSSPEQACRMAYNIHPFIESRVISEYIKSHSEPTDTIAVLGSEPQIYFYTNRRAATGHIYTYALMEDHPNAVAMQTEMAGEIEKADPLYIVLVNMQASWVVRPTSKMQIFEWFSERASRYKLVGLVDITADGPKYLWDAQATNAVQSTSNSILILRREQGAAGE